MTAPHDDHGGSGARVSSWRRPHATPRSRASWPRRDSTVSSAPTSRRWPARPPPGPAHCSRPRRRVRRGRRRGPWAGRRVPRRAGGPAGVVRTADRAVDARRGQSPAASDVVRSLANVTLLERPAATRSVVSAVQAALRDRVRRCALRDQIARLRAADEANQALLARRAGRAGRGGARQPDQGRVPRHPLPRAAHAAQRDPRLGRRSCSTPRARSRGAWPKALDVIERNARAQTQLDRRPAGHEPHHLRQGAAGRAARSTCRRRSRPRSSRCAPPPTPRASA